MDDFEVCPVFFPQTLKIADKYLVKELILRKLRRISFPLRMNLLAATSMDEFGLTLEEFSSSSSVSDEGLICTGQVFSNSDQSQSQNSLPKN